MDSVRHQFSLVMEVKHTCPQPVTGLVSRLVYTGSNPILHTNLCFQKHGADVGNSHSKMNDDELRMVDKQGESMVASFRYMDISNLAYK